jgi:hypothetical protein
MGKIDELLSAIWKADEAEPRLAYKLWNILSAEMMMKDMATTDQLAADLSLADYFVHFFTELGTD